MSAELEFIQNMKNAERSATRQRMIEYGELIVYDPKTHSAKFELTSASDETDGPNEGESIETPFIKILNLGTGPNYGTQFPPAQGAQAVVFFMAPALPICAAFINNAVEAPPFPSGNSAGWKDIHGNTITTTENGLNFEDFSGNKIETTSDGVVITSKQGWTITMNAPGITLAAPQVGVGDSFGNLGSGNALARNSDLQTTADNAKSADQANITALIQAIQAAGVPNSSMIVAPNAANISGAPGSPSVRAK